MKKFFIKLLFFIGFVASIIGGGAESEKWIGIIIQFVLFFSGLGVCFFALWLDKKYAEGELTDLSGYTYDYD